MLSGERSAVLPGGRVALADGAGRVAGCSANDLRESHGLIGKNANKEIQSLHAMI